MARRDEISAGLLAFRRQNGLQFLLAHPGGPFWVRKDNGAWTIPKGLVRPDDLLEGALREFNEETGLTSSGPYVPLKPVRQRSGKTVHGFAFEADLDLSKFESNTFELEWPPRSGKYQEFPEVDRVCFFSEELAKRKLKSRQVPFLDRLRAALAVRATDPSKRATIS